MDGKWDYVYSCDISANIQIKVSTLEGKLEGSNFKQLIDDPLLRFSGTYQSNCCDLFVTCQVFAGGHPLALPVCTSYKAFTTRWNWNQWLTLPVRYCDLPRNAVLALTVWDIYGCSEFKPVGGTTISFFGKYGRLRKNMHDLKVWPDVEADCSDQTTTPGKSKLDTMARLAKLTKKHKSGQLAKLDWLDRLTFREIEQINEKEKRGSNFMYLMIEFSRITFQGVEVDVLYYEPGVDGYQVNSFPSIVTLPDPEIDKENPVESKHHHLARSLRSGPTDKDLKPNATIRNQLRIIVDYPPTKTLTSEEQDLMWKFRFYLSSQKKALTKFLKSVHWSAQQEAKQALELLYKWAPMDVGDALELLSPIFTDPTVRRYAVTRLRHADDDDLQLYLIQLVQALKNEDHAMISAAYKREYELAQMSLSSTNEDQAQFNRSHSEAPSSPPAHFITSISQDDSTPRESLNSEFESNPLFRRDSELTQGTIFGGGLSREVDLATFLIERASQNFKLANYLHWYLCVECEDPESPGQDMKKVEMYNTMLKRLQIALKLSRIEPGCEAILAQQAFIAAIVSLVKSVARESGNRKKKIERLQSMLVDPGELRFNFTSFPHLPLPLDPDVWVHGIVPDKAILFKSALMPCRFHFRTNVSGEEYVTIFKHGDDLRQDQLILQTITLMDQLLRKENLDLRLTPYKVLATSSKHGFVQFIESTAISEVLSANDGSILAFFRKHAPSENSPLGVAPEVLDNYIKSCAGYCMITYILGVGDRHLDNLLLTKSGKLFHIDFGFILGRDPKPMPPPFKLTKEMVEAMGGTNSEHFMAFKKLCYTVFLHLRRASNLILNLFSLMIEANIPDIAIEPDKTVKKVQDRFRLDLTDEEAVHFLQTVIDFSSNATMANVMDQLHKIAQYWKS